VKNNSLTSVDAARFPPSLEFLEVSHNKLTLIDNAIGPLKSLTHLIAASNHLEMRSLLDALRMTKLKQLDLCKNWIAGRLPEEFGINMQKMEYIEYIGLQSKQLVVPLPESLASMTRKITLDLSGTNEFDMQSYPETLVSNTFPGKSCAILPSKVKV
jgi:Leucine-rich repeat (LRR) protein